MKTKRILSLTLAIVLTVLSIHPISVISKAEQSTTLGYTVTYRTISDWGDGFNGELTITNTGVQPITDWSLEFDFDRNIRNFWTAKLLNYDNNHYHITHSDWNRTINKGDSLVLGFGGSPGNVTAEPTNFKLNSSTEYEAVEETPNNSSEEENSELNDYSITSRIVSQWNGSYNAEVIIQNTGNNVIENWQLRFDSLDKIINIWNATIRTHENDSYIVSNAVWNQDIQPGQTVMFGYTANYDSKINLPENFSMDMICSVVDDKLYEVSQKITNGWHNGFTGQITIKNTSDEIIEDWKLSFESSAIIDNFYDAKIVHKEQNTYYINNSGYNSNLKPGETIELGFIGSSSYEDAFRNFSLMEMRLFDPEETFIDTDDDKIPDHLEIQKYNTNPNNPDTDLDGFSDYEEIFILFTDPLVANNSNADMDEDNILDIDEIKYGTDPYNPDTDGDDITDFEEINTYRTDPLNADSDEDGLNDGEEIILGFNPLKKDTFSDGIIDSDRYVKQTYSEIIDENGIENIEFTMDCKGFIDNTIFLSINDYSSIVQAKGVIGIPIEFDIMTDYKNAKISFEYNESLLDVVEKDNLSLAFYEEDGDAYNLIESTIDGQSKLVYATIDTTGTYFLIDKSKLSQQEIDANKVIVGQQRIRAISATKQKKLKTELLKIMKKDSAFKGIKGSTRTYSLEKTFDMVMKYDKEITAAAKSLNVNKALVQSILMREIACINESDTLADILVIQYFQYQADLEEFMNAPFWKQILLGAPKAPLRTSKDSSTGLGQIFASTAISANNLCVKNNIISGSKLDINNWKARRTVWENLKYKDDYNINKVALVLKYESLLNDVISLDTPKKDDAILVLGEYNGNRTYGKVVYKYYKLFNKYGK